MTRKIASTNWFPETEVVAPVVAVEPGLAPEVVSADRLPTVRKEPATPATESEASVPPAAPPDFEAIPGTTGKKARPPKVKAERRPRPHREKRPRTLAASEVPPRPTPKQPRAPRVEAAAPPRAMRAERRRTRTTWRKVMSLAIFALVVGAWFVTLRPSWLGGPASVLTVRGVSMEPTYRYGDIIIAHGRSDYRPGDIIAFRVPEGEVGAGAVVIHRIIGGDATSGFITQGDNNPDPDEWRPVPTDILGAARWRIPMLGRLMSSLRTVPGIALVAGTLAAIIVALGAESPDRRRARRPKGDADQPATGSPEPQVIAEMHSDVAAHREAPEVAPDPDPIDAPPVTVAAAMPAATADEDPLDDLIVPPPLPSTEPITQIAPPRELTVELVAYDEGSDDDVLSMDLHLGRRRRPPAPVFEDDEPSLVGEYWGDLGYLAALLRPKQEPVLFDDELEPVAGPTLRAVD